MAYIGRQLARGENKLFDDISSSFNGSTTTFNLTVSSVATATATPYQLFVSLGGVMQKPNTDFTTAGNQITFTTAPAAGLSCWIMMQGDTIDQAAIPDSSVTPSKISGSNFAFSGDLRLKDADGSHYVGFASPTTVASNKVWTLPAADGSASQYLQTNGSGVLSWSTVSVGGATGIDFNDSVKTRYGTGNDLEIFHSGSNAHINHVTSGNMFIDAVGDITFRNTAGTENRAKFANNGAVELYHDNVKKFETSAAGVSITGALTVSTNATITGDLTVSGTTTTINTQTLDVEDKNVVIGKVSSPSDTTADGGGWTLKGASDKTFNWVNSTDAWTSSEHIHLIDNKKLFVGGASGTTDGCEIYHNGSNTLIHDTGTGNLAIQSNGAEIQLSKGGSFEHMVRAIVDGAVELYHDNSKKLETTSGGINVTGAINVNGSALASGNSIDLVADGAIGAGKPVLLTNAGKVTAITMNNQNITNPSLKSQTSLPSNLTGNHMSGIWNETTDKGLIMYQTGSNVKYRQFRLNATGSISNVDNEIAADNVAPYQTKIIHDPDIDKPIMFWKRGSDNQYVYSRSVTIDGGGSNVPQASTQGASAPRSVAMQNNKWDVCYDTNANIFVFVYKYHSDGKGYVRLGYQSEPATGQHKIIWINTDVEFSSDCESPRCVFDTVNNKVIIAWGQAGGDVSACIGTVSNSGSSATISVGSRVVVNSVGPGSSGRPKMAWNTTDGVAGYLYQRSDNNQNALIILKTSGTTVHYNSLVQVGTENRNEMAIWYVSSLGKFQWSVTGRIGWISSTGTPTSGGSGSSAATVGSGTINLANAIAGSINDWEPSSGFDLPEHPLVTGHVSVNNSDSGRLKIMTLLIVRQYQMQLMPLN